MRVQVIAGQYDGAIGSAIDSRADGRITIVLDAPMHGRTIVTVPTEATIELEEA